MSLSFAALKNKKYILFAVCALSFLAVSVALDVSLLFAAVMLLWGGLVIFTLHDLKNRAAYLIFLIAFFLFLLGGEFFELYMGYYQDYTFPENINIHAYICLLISLAFIHTGYYATEKISDKRSLKKNKAPKYEFYFTEKIRKTTRIGLYVSVVPYFLTVLDAGLYTLKHGYLSYYTDYHSRLPEIVEMISDLFPMFLFFFLATLPPKKQCLLPMILYLAHGASALITGRRIMFGVAMLVLGCYIIIRHFINPSEGWLSKKKIIIILALCPVILIAMYAQRYIRYGQSMDVNFNIFDIIFRFLSQQGSSIGILKHQKVLEGDQLGCTSLYYTIHYLRGNFLTRGFFDFPMDYYMHRSVETAYETNCLADYIMFKVNASDFFAGYGLGTSYIAELNHDLGYAGVALGSTIYGFLLSWLYSANHFSFWKFSIGFMILEEFTIMPRYGADVIMRPFYNLTKMFVMVLLIVFTLFSKEDIIRLFKKGKRSES